MARSQTLKEVVRTMICRGKEMMENPSSILIDDLQRLGISYHFMKEISKVLENIYCNYYKSHEEWSKMDLNLKSLGFSTLATTWISYPSRYKVTLIRAHGVVRYTTPITR
ncbi:putative lyase [Helianthus anomalus]